MSGPNERRFSVNDPYRRRFPNPNQWPSNVVYGLYAEVKTQAAVNEMSWEWAGEQVADETAAFLRAETDRQARRANAQAEDWKQGEPGA